MAEETANKPAQNPLTKEQAVQAYLDADTNEKKAAIYAANPVLKSVFSEGNHHTK